jgi:hypothetical protein
MTEPLALEDAAFKRAQDEINGVHAELKKEQGDLAQAVSSLMAGGWTGIAAHQFGEGWEDWVAGCDLVLDGLVGMDAAMTSAFQETHHVDGAQGAAMAWLRSRLGGDEA